MCPCSLHLVILTTLISSTKMQSGKALSTHIFLILTPAQSAFGIFYNKIYHWYPVLHIECFDTYLAKIGCNLVSSSESCIVLLIAAIGSVAQCSSLAAVYENRPGAGLVASALSMLPSVQFDFSLRSVQCLILLSIYYKCIGKPCQAHDYILIASCKAQALFKW
jgi:hypothetical protein